MVLSLAQMWPTDKGLGTCPKSKQGYHIFSRRAVKLGESGRDWMYHCRYCGVVQQISLVPQRDKLRPKVETTYAYPNEDKANEYLSSHYGDDYKI